MLLPMPKTTLLVISPPDHYALRNGLWPNSLYWDCYFISREYSA